MVFENLSPELQVYINARTVAAAYIEFTLAASTIGGILGMTKDAARKKVQYATQYGNAVNQFNQYSVMMQQGTTPKKEDLEALAASYKQLSSTPLYHANRNLRALARRDLAIVHGYLGQLGTQPTGLMNRIDALPSQD